MTYYVMEQYWGVIGKQEAELEQVQEAKRLNAKIITEEEAREKKKNEPGASIIYGRL